MFKTMYFQDCKERIVYEDDSSIPSTLFEKGIIKLVVAGLKVGQTISVREESLEIYHYLAGQGVMTVDETRYEIRPGTTIVVPKGAIHEISAETNMSYLETRITPCHKGGDNQCDQDSDPN